MDLLFKRYSNPYIFLDSMLESGCFNEAITHVWNFEQEDLSWEYFLSKIWDKTFDEFKNEMISSIEKLEPIKEEIVEAAVIKSKNILDGFTPERKE